MKCSIGIKFRLHLPPSTVRSVYLNRSLHAIRFLNDFHRCCKMHFGQKQLKCIRLSELAYRKHLHSMFVHGKHIVVVFDTNTRATYKQQWVIFKNLGLLQHSFSLHVEKGLRRYPISQSQLNEFPAIFRSVK